MAAKSSQTPKSNKQPTATAGTAGVRRIGPGRIRFEVLVAAIVMLVSVCLLFPEIAFENKIFFAGDSEAAFSFSIPGSQALQGGEYPVWNPYLFGGMPSYASASYLPRIYPVNYLIGYIIRFLRMPMYTWLLFHFVMMGMGVYLLLRDRKVHYGAAMAAGVLMMWMPNFVAVAANGHGSQACASAFIPFAILLWDRLWRGKAFLPHACGLVLLLGTSMLRGHLQISYYTYAAIGFHFLFFGTLKLVDGFKGRSPDESILPRKVLAGLTAGKRYSIGAASVEVGFAALVLTAVVAASILASAVLYMPLHDYAQYSVRGATVAGGADYDFATSWSLHPIETLTFIVPYALGFGKDLYYGYMPFTDYPNYLGIVVFAIAVFALFRVRTRIVMFFGCMALLTTFVSFGKFVPGLYDLMFHYLPYFNKFRVPVMILIVQQVSVVVLFGIGLDAIIRSNDDAGKGMAVKVLAGAFIFFAIALLTQNFWGGDFAEGIASRIRSGQNPSEQLAVARVAGRMLANDLMRTGIMIALACIAMFVYFNNRRVPTAAFLAAILVIGVVDFHLVDRHVIHPEEFRHYESLRLLKDTSVRDDFRKVDGEIEFLKKDTRPFRIFPLDSPGFASNRYMVFGISSVGGYHPAKLKWVDNFIRNAFTPSLGQGRIDLVDMLNVRYLISRSPMSAASGFPEVWRGQNFQGEQKYIYENPGATDRVHFVGKYRVADDEQALALLAAGSVPLKEEVILDRKPAIEPVSAEGTSGRITEYGFNHIAIEADVDKPCLLVLSEVYYPRWVVEVDGQPAETLRANYILRAVALPAGRHELVFRYDDSLLRRGFMLTASTFGACGLLIVGWFIPWPGNKKRGSVNSNTNV